MKRRVVSADDVLRSARAGAAELVVAPGDRVTPLAHDVARDHGVRIVVDPGEAVRRLGPGAPAPPGTSPRGGYGAAAPDHVAPVRREFGTAPPAYVTGQSGASGVAARTSTSGRLRHVPGAATMPLTPFPFPGPAPELDVRTTDVVTSRDGLPMAAGVMSMREGSFPWTLTYDEIEYVLEGELHLTCGEQRVVGRPGDVIAVPRGSAITFGTPSWTRFLYVTYPADWGSS